MKHLGLLVSIVLLAGCASSSPDPQQVLIHSINAQMAAQKDAINDSVLDQIDNSANVIAANIATLNEYNYMKSGKVTLPLSQIHSPDLNVPLMLAWSGPIQNLLPKIAALLGYQYQAYGSVPPIPILVELHTDNAKVSQGKGGQSARGVLIDLNAQISGRAKIFVNPQYKLLSLRYMN